MANKKAKMVCMTGTAYYPEAIFEYRGKTYTVEYSSGFTTFKKEPAYLQHQREQKRIDGLLDNPVDHPVSTQKPFDIDEIFELLGWD